MKANRNNSYLSNLITKYNTIIYILNFIPNFKTLLRFVRCYIKVNLLKRNQLRFVELFVTLACNARCDFCSNGLYTRNDKQLSLEKYLSIIDECASLDVPVICMLGGEPLLNKHIDQMVKRISSHGIISMITTNGSLLTEDRIKELAQNGLTAITCSLQSLDEEKHDASVKLKVSYKRIFQAREYCRKYGVHFGLITVVSHKDFVDGTFDRLINFALDEKIPLCLNPLLPVGSAHDKKEDLLHYEDVQKLNKLSKENVWISTHLTNNFFGFGCPAGNSYVGVYASGEMFPCFFIPVSLGNVQEMTLKEAWEKACRSPLFAKRHKMCYVGTSKEFICNYLDPIFKSDRIPMPIEEHPLWRDQQLPDLKISDVKDAIEYKE
jgi:MoaA/NifB/PqqE/SkfB family radical SAM enzyme